MARPLERNLQFSGRNNQQVAKNSADKEVVTIVQCPSCQARFTIATDLIVGIESPRFHCSRCDHVFENQEKLCVEETIEREYIAELPAAEEKIDDRQQTDTRSSGWSIDKESPSQGLQIPGRVIPGRVNRGETLGVPWGGTLGAPHEQSQQRWIDEDEEQLEFDFAAAAAANSTRTDTSFVFKQDSIDHSEKAEARNYREAKESDFEPVTEVPKEITKQFRQRKMTSPWRSTMIITAPIVGFLTLLLFFSIYMNSNTSSAEQIFRGLFPNTAKIAPTGLSVDQIKFEIINLASGEKSALVHGRLHNQSGEDFKEIIVEGLAFDAKGKLLLSKRINSSSPLAKTRIKSFTLDMIEELQNRTPAKQLKLENGQKRDFAVAMIGEQMRAARFFSARAYSVR